MSLNFSSIKSESSETMSPLLQPSFLQDQGNRSLDNCNTPEIGPTILCDIEASVKDLLQDVCFHSEFAMKYDLSPQKLGDPFMYAVTTFDSPYKYTLEAFPRIDKPSPDDLTKGPQAFKFHDSLEAAIERFTLTRAKPNPVVCETRSSDFCYPVTIHIEAVPHEKAKKPYRLLLLREFQILVAIWDQFRQDLRTKKCTADQLIGFPMPFEFCSVLGTDLEFPARQLESYNYYNVKGILVDVKESFGTPLTTCNTMNSTLSYMSMEKLGPSVTYLLDLMRSQSRAFSLSSALMVFDQLICRLAVMHRYGVAHGDLNTDCLRFGSGNACNVLYISDFSTAVLLPSKAMPAFLFHDRFVSAHKIRNKCFHFVHDLEAAYYIFLLLTVGCLPWDSRLKTAPRISLPWLTAQRLKDSSRLTDMTSSLKDKKNFWESATLMQRLVNSREYELDGGLYRSFIEDLMMTIYLKMKDILFKCSCISNENYLHDLAVYGTAASHSYLNLRKTIASYFRFETQSAFLKDPAADAKIGMLKAQDPLDRRVAWDVSSWCWNYICIDVKTSGSLAPSKTCSSWLTEAASELSF